MQGFCAGLLGWGGLRRPPHERLARRLPIVGGLIIQGPKRRLADAGGAEARPLHHADEAPCLQLAEPWSHRVAMDVERLGCLPVA